MVSMDLAKEKLMKLPTHRLLAYYRKQFAKEMAFQHSLYCECCGEPLYEYDNTSDEEYERRKNEHYQSVSQSDSYLKMIKSILATREHINRKK